MLQDMNLPITQIRRPLFLFLSILYLAGVVQVESLHGLLHDDHNAAAVHSLQNEADPCHLRLFHEKAGRLCDHETHLTRPSDCPLCQYCSPLPHLAPTLTKEIPSLSTDDPFVDGLEGEPFNTTLSRDSRGPPQA
jgi:hypothetical protein